MSMVILALLFIGNGVGPGYGPVAFLSMVWLEIPPLRAMERDLASRTMKKGCINSLKAWRPLGVWLNKRFKSYWTWGEI